MPLSSAELSRLVDQHWGTLCNWLGPNNGQTDDVIQKAFIKLAAQNPPPDNCLAWLFTVTRRLATNVQIAESRRAERERISSELRVDPSNDHAETTRKLDIEHHLDSLSDDQRSIVVAKIWGQLSFDQIAEMLEVSRSSVYREYQTSLQILKQSMSKP